MNMFKSLGILLLFSVLVTAYCDYEENFEINDIYLNTLYPELGEIVELHVIVQGDEYSTNVMKIYLDEGYYTELVTKEEIYISKGINEFVYEIKVPEIIPHNVGYIEVEIGKKNESIPIIIENEYSDLITEISNDENYTLSVKNNESIRFKVSNGVEKRVVAKSINGTVNLTIKKCNDCEVLISFDYMNEKMKIYNEFGNYQNEFVKINKIENNEIEFENCPHKKIENVKYETGYEKIFVEGTEFDLSKFYCEEINKIEIINNQPLVLKVKATDYLNRIVNSKGDLLLKCESNNYLVEVEFFGEEEYTFDLKTNTTCNITYNDAKNNVKVLAVEKDIIDEEKENIIFWEDYVTYGLVILTVIVMVVLFNNWRKINKKW